MLLQEYLAELRKIQILESGEEALLWRGYKEEGDLNCRGCLIEHYQPLVFREALRWRGNQSIIMDLIQEGTVGLIEAAETYDHTRRVAFSLYAVHRIRGRMMNYLEKEGKFNLAYIDSPLEGLEGASTLGECLPDTAATVSDTIEQLDLVEQVRSAMKRLPLKEQMVLTGVFVEEQEPKELAQNMDLSISHIYRLQKQGIRRVRGMLSRLMQEMKGK